MVVFQVGDKEFDCDDSILSSFANSFFHVLVNGTMALLQTEKNKTLIIERDPVLFEIIVNYMKNGEESFKELDWNKYLVPLQVEADFYLLEKLSDFLKHFDFCQGCGKMFYFEDRFYYENKGPNQNLLEPKCESGNYHQSENFSSYLNIKILHPAFFEEFGKYFFVATPLRWPLLLDPPITPEIIKTVETALGVTFPDEVKRSFIEWNGLSLNKDALFVDYGIELGRNDNVIPLCISLYWISNWFLYDYPNGAERHFKEHDGVISEPEYDLSDSGSNHSESEYDASAYSLPKRIVLGPTYSDAGVPYVLLDTKTWHIDIYTNNISHVTFSCQSFGDWIKSSFESVKTEIQDQLFANKSKNKIRKLN